MKTINVAFEINQTRVVIICIVIVIAIFMTSGGTSKKIDSCVEKHGVLVKPYGTSTYRCIKDYQIVE